MKSESCKYVRDVFIWCKIQEKITANYNSFGKMMYPIYPIKGHRLLSPCQKCMDKFFDPFSDILVN